jgi:hypothetical protein
LSPTHARIANSPRMPRNLRVGSLLLYPSYPVSAAENQANALVRYGVKRAEHDVLKSLCDRAAVAAAHPPLSEILWDAGLLVPVPGSALRRAGDLWVPELIAQYLHDNFIGDGVDTLLKRTTAVPRSTGVTRSAGRPTVEQHTLSLEVTRALAPQRITLVDDVITIGRTVFGCAARLHAAFPDVDIRVFALARTVRHTRLQTEADAFRPVVSTYVCLDDGYIGHDQPR